MPLPAPRDPEVTLEYSYGSHSTKNTCWVTNLQFKIQLAKLGGSLGTRPSENRKCTEENVWNL